MNQILLTNNDNNNKKNNNKNYNRNNSNDIKKIITFFAVIILVFGIAVSAIYGYKIFKNSNKEESIGEPEILLENTNEEVTIIAKAEAGISKIIYQWNDEEENVKELGGRTKQEEKIDIPVGNNTLKVKIIDQIGQEKERTESFTKAGQENSDKIKISLEAIEEGEEKGKLKILVTSELPIKYMTYRWNEEEETKIETEEGEEKTSLETNIEVKRGKNSIIVFAEDIEGNNNSVENKCDGRLKPEFEVYREDNRLYMKITHDKGFKKIDFIINGQEFTYDETKADYNSEKQIVEYYFNLQEGENTVEITAYSNEDTNDTYEGRCNLE
jgi:hypothetical protein